ncbi:hypothetical protein EDD52_115101 [Primorskyibacter sedentarius]|uniref:Uncharacterized protein n=1 Tax=Primorskyibacter sedentarius TaxID=745311 RepID=A0A4V2UN18_9RHOB|nr:hypothetical protein [Primorskyibacter sedentarius]TCS60281.1 hypothetical protein EDD52_115101 [Primorskyibacter sedentarius]
MSDGLALFIGAAIIAFFSYDRFDRETHQGGRQLERVVSLLSPNKMRAQRVVLRAYIFYALALLVIYLFMCAYAELLPYFGGPDFGGEAIGAREIPIVGADNASQVTTGFNPAEAPGSQQLSNEASPKEENKRLGVDSTVSLTVALIIVGLAPSFPALQRVEGWIRLTSHRLAGIPTWVIGASEDLSRNTLGIVSSDTNAIPDNQLLIPRGFWERMLQYQIGARGKLTAPDEFRHDLEIIFATATWILNRKLKLANLEAQRAFDPLAESLRQRTASLIQQLDEKSDFRPGHSTPPSVASDPKPEEKADVEQKGNDIPIELQRESWERLAEETADLANDLHILLALYVEHEIITAEQDNPTTNAGPKDITRQRILARKKLQKFLGSMLEDRRVPGRLPLSTMTIWFWTIAVVLSLALLWSMGPGRLETALQLYGNSGNFYSRAITYTLGASNQYCIPILVALMIRDGARQADRWNNICDSHWTRGLPQAIFVIGFSWTVAALIIVGLGLWQSALTLSWEANREVAWTALRAIFEYNAPSAFRGAVLAWLVLYLLDWPTPNDNEESVSSLRWAVWAAIIMALCGALTRFAMSQAALAHNTRTSLDDIDRGLIAYAAIYAGLIGFAVMFCLSEAIRSARVGNPARSSTGRRSKASADAAPQNGE